MDRPVRAARLAELAGAVEGIDDPHPVTAEPPRVLEPLLGQDRVVGPDSRQLVGEEALARRVTPVHHLPGVGAPLDQVLAHGDEAAAGLVGQSGGELGVGLHGDLRHAVGDATSECLLRGPPCAKHSGDAKHSDGSGQPARRL